MIRIISIGKTNVDFVQSGLKTYLDRLKHYAKVEWVELPDVKRVDKNDKELLKEKEGIAFLDQIQSNDQVLVMDEQGKSISSKALAKKIDEHQLYGSGDLVFLIGGAYGFSADVYARANQKISLSSMTFTHQMARLILAEQIYRAFTIIKGEPYHHS